MSDRRTYIGELEHAIGQISIANHDRNPNRQAQIQGWLQYANEVSICRRGHEPIPPRPNGEFV